MNQDQAVSIVTKLIIAACAGIAAKLGFSSDLAGLSATIAPAIVALAVFAYSHWYNGQSLGQPPIVSPLPAGWSVIQSGGSVPLGQPPIVSPLPKVRRLVTLLALGAIAVSLTGCTSVYTNGCVTVVQTRGFGLRVTATGSSTSTPEIDFEAFSSYMSVYPTSTNALSCAPFFTTATANTTINPFDVGINETIGAGNVTANIGTNGTSGASTIIPKVAKPQVN